MSEELNRTTPTPELPSSVSPDDEMWLALSVEGAKKPPTISGGYGPPWVLDPIPLHRRIWGWLTGRWDVTYRRTG